MKQYKSIKTLNNAIDKWFFNEILSKSFKYKGNLENEKEIKKFMKAKNIHTVSDIYKDTEKIFVYCKNKLKFSAFINYLELTLELEYF